MQPPWPDRISNRRLAGTMDLALDYRRMFHQTMSEAVGRSKGGHTGNNPRNRTTALQNVSPVGESTDGARYRRRAPPRPLERQRTSRLPLFAWPDQAPLLLTARLG